MRFVRIISVSGLERYIESAWSNDADLVLFYDDNLVLKEHKNMVYNTCSKIEEYINNSSFAWMYGIEYEGSPIGFVVVNVNTRLLYSFGVNKKYRVAKVLSSVWDFIYRILKANFSCFLFKHNKRAITWLEKCGMKVEKYEGLDEQMIYLKIS